jgi:hypothetical protein
MNKPGTGSGTCASLLLESIALVESSLLMLFNTHRTRVVLAEGSVPSLIHWRQVDKGLT